MERISPAACAFSRVGREGLNARRNIDLETSTCKIHIEKIEAEFASRVGDRFRSPTGAFVETSKSKLGPINKQFGPKSDTCLSMVPCYSPTGLSPYAGEVPQLHNAHAPTPTRTPSLTCPVAHMTSTSMQDCGEVTLGPLAVALRYAAGPRAPPRLRWTTGLGGPSLLRWATSAITPPDIDDG